MLSEEGSGREPADFESLIEMRVREFDASGITDTPSRQQRVSQALLRLRAELLGQHGLDARAANTVLDRFVKQLAVRLEAEGLWPRRSGRGGMTSVLWHSEGGRPVGRVDPGEPRPPGGVPEPVSRSAGGVEPSRLSRDGGAFEASEELMRMSEVVGAITRVPRSETGLSIDRLRQLPQDTPLAGRTLNRPRFDAASL
jgi:hypothetical protein